MVSVRPWTPDRPPTARRGGGPERPLEGVPAKQKDDSRQVGICWGTATLQLRRAHMRREVCGPECCDSRSVQSNMVHPPRPSVDMQQRGRKVLLPT